MPDKIKTPIPQMQDHPWERWSRTWRLVGSPMRPIDQDLGYYWGSISEWIEEHGPPRVLLLGVTPELYSLPWPEGTDFLAVDYTQTMIDSVWPGPKEAAQLNDWCRLNLPAGSRDIVLCDGGLHLLSYPGEQKKLLRLLRAILSDQGLGVFRLFALPTVRESPDAILQDLLQGKISHISILKVRLAMALQRSPEEGVPLGWIYDKIYQTDPNFENLAEKVGWTFEQMMTINNYKDLSYRFYFLTVKQVVDMLCRDPGGFSISRIQIPSYEPLERCPTIALRCCHREGTTIGD